MERIILLCIIGPEYRGCNPLADCNKNMILEQESAVIENDTCASSLPTSTVTRTIGKTTYIANLHFRELGQTFSQKLKRVLIAECS